MGIRHTKKILSNNKEIHVFDNIFSSAERLHHIQVAQGANYKLGSNSNHVFRNQSDTFFMSLLYNDDEDLDGMFECFGFLKSNKIDSVTNVLKDFDLKRSWILASSPLTKYYWHVDVSEIGIDSRTVLYHVNDKWDDEWGGETMFANDDGQCEFCVEYKPGRIVIFDGSLAHKPGVISPRAEEFRFMYVMQYSNEEYTCDEHHIHRHTY
jgi:Rps23 Pro-64 3,4-dihydroxylase Tpa1-like proline 4-hydroxylase